MSFDLHRFEQWMLTAIRHPDGVEAGVAEARDLMGVGPDDLESLVLPSATRSGTQRLGVYANMYFTRLVGILEGDHPALAYALGDDFDERMRQFLCAHPSRHYRLTPLGDPLPGWLRDEAAGLEHAEFLADLASLERAKEAVFNERRSEVLDPDALASIPPEAWENARPALIPALRLLATRYPVNRYFQAVMDETEPGIPEAEAAYVMVWRQEWKVWRADLTEPQFVILDAFSSGATLGEALERALERDGVDEDTLLSEVGGWFSFWSADQVFARIDRSD